MKTMELRVRFGRMGKTLKKALLADMHRMACGWGGQELPATSVESRLPPKKPMPLKFSWRSRQRMGWMGFMLRGGF